MIGKCQLCLEEKELQPKSHIIPDFFYRESDLFHHQYHNLVTTDLLTILNKGKVKVLSNKQKTGYYDKYILCYDCEHTILNSYETYGMSFFYSQNLPKNQIRIGNICREYRECLNSDYTKLKLLFLSILWRSGISNKQMFDNVRLEDNQQEEIRTMILNGDPKSESDYPIVFLCSLTDESISRDHFIQPIRVESKISGMNNFIFFFGGFVLIFAQKKSDIPDILTRYQIFENGTFRAGHLYKGQTWNMIKKLYGS